MKRFIMLQLISMVFFPLLAEERNIELQEKNLYTERRSLAYIPTVTYDSNIIRIYSDIPLEDLQVTITNIFTEATYYFNNINVFYSQPYTLYLDYVESGNYKIEINIKGTCYYGYFETTSNGIE